MAAPPPPRPPPWPPSLDCVAFPWGSHRSGVAGDWADAAAATWAVDKGARCWGDAGEVNDLTPTASPDAALDLLAALAGERAPAAPWEAATVAGLHAFAFTCPTHPAWRSLSDVSLLTLVDGGLPADAARRGADALLGAALAPAVASLAAPASQALLEAVLRAGGSRCVGEIRGEG